MAAFLSSCYSVSHYSGDGRLVDRGRSAATDRYILDLGEVDLKKHGIFTYRLENLPSEYFVIGIEIEAPSEKRTLLDRKFIKPIILIELIGSQDETIIQDQSSLDVWTWSVRATDNKAFVYRREQPSTFFEPITKKRYELRIETVQPDLSEFRYTARLLAKAGGWK
ncbi:MAG: hypothetical protein ACE5GK_08000 [Nitrospiria bacterium]